MKFFQYIEILQSVVSKQAIPRIYTLVDISFSEFFDFEEFFSNDKKFQKFEAVANGVGIVNELEKKYRGLSIVDLKYLMKSEIESTGAEDRDLFAVAFAACFFSKTFQESNYRAVVEAFDSNIHVMIPLIHLLLLLPNLITNEKEDKGLERIEKLKRIEKIYLETSSRILLKFYENTPKTIVNLPSLYIFLDKFLESCSLLQRDDLDQYIPYPMLASMYASLFQRKTGEKKGEEEI